MFECEIRNFSKRTTKTYYLNILRMTKYIDNEISHSISSCIEIEWEYFVCNLEKFDYRMMNAESYAKNKYIKLRKVNQK